MFYLVLIVDFRLFGTFFFVIIPRVISLDGIQKCISSISSLTCVQFHLLAFDLSYKSRKQQTPHNRTSHSSSAYFVDECKKVLENVSHISISTNVACFTWTTSLLNNGGNAPDLKFRLQSFKSKRHTVFQSRIFGKLESNDEPCNTAVQEKVEQPL